MKVDLKSLAVVILNYCSAEETCNLVRQLESFKSNFWIIVVDNNSPDGSYDILLSQLGNIPYVEVIKSKQNRGYSAGNNIGFRYAIKRYHVNSVCVMNPDVFIPNLSVLETMHSRLFSKDEYGVIGGATIDIDGVYNPMYSGWNIPGKKELISNLYSRNKRTVKPVHYQILEDNLAASECVVGCFFIMKTELLLKMNYLDESFFLYNEENVLGIECKKLGYREVIALDQFYYHNHNFDKHKEKKLAKRILDAKINYQSRRHFCELYYPSYMQLPLFLVHILNIIVVTIACIKFWIRSKI